MQRLWRSTTNRVMTILDTVQSLKQASELDPNNVWACANLLDSHLMQVKHEQTAHHCAPPVLLSCSTLKRHCCETCRLTFFIGGLRASRSGWLVQRTS